MGLFDSIKKAVKDVAHVATAPARVVSEASRTVLDKTGINSVVKKSLGVDINNITKTSQDTSQLKGSTGSSSFRRAFVDTAKIGAAAYGGSLALGSYVSSGMGATTLGTIYGTSKAIGAVDNLASGNGKVGDIAGLFGVDTTFGDFDFGNIGIGNKKTKSVPDSFSPGSFSSDLGEDVGPKQNNKILIYSAIGIISIFMLVKFSRR